MKTKTTKLNQAQLRTAFWESVPSMQHLRRRSWRQNQYPCDVRCAWVDFVDMMHRGGAITDHTSHIATL